MFWRRRKARACPQCGSALAVREVPRLGVFAFAVGSVAKAVGAFLAVPVIVLVIVTNVWRDGPQDLLRTSKDVSFDMAVIQLEAIDGGPWPFVKEFKETSTVSPQTMERLPDPPRSQVAAVLEAHRLRTAADREQIAKTGLAVFRWSLYALGAGIAIAIVGGVMAVSYRVERCDACGHEARGA